MWSLWNIFSMRFLICVVHLHRNMQVTGVWLEMLSTFGAVCISSSVFFMVSSQNHTCHHTKMPNFLTFRFSFSKTEGLRLRSPSPALSSNSPHFRLLLWVFSKAWVGWWPCTGSSQVLAADLGPVKIWMSGSMNVRWWPFAEAWGL